MIQARAGDLRITSWNVNSVRLRLDGLARLVRTVDPAVLCLQETKVRNELFPVLEVRALGFPHHVLHGQILRQRAPLRSHKKA